MEKDIFSQIQDYKNINDVCAANIDQSLPASLNYGSQKTLYQSVRNTIYEDLISMDSMYTATSTQQDNPDEQIEIHKINSETVRNGSYADRRNLSRDFQMFSDPNGTTGLFFQDEIRTIDFVLVWDKNIVGAKSYSGQQWREVYEENLKGEGLELEYEEQDVNGLNFIKIHAPIEVLKRYAEILKLRMPMKEISDIKIPSRGIPIVKEVGSLFKNFMKRYHPDTRMFPPMAHRFTAIYSRDKEYLFDIESNFFSSSIKSKIIQFILDRTRFSKIDGDCFAFGIERLISQKVYDSAYPLHDGSLKTPGSLRYLLYTEWANLQKCLNYQPLDYIKEYFGVKIGLYFAWLGFYTSMLIPASIIGIFSFIYGCTTLKYNQPNEDICQMNITMCPLCDHCKYWELQETCLFARITYLFDNSSTVIFSVFMSLWAALFLELWKRYSAEITHRWDLSKMDTYEEQPRPDYLARLAHVKKKRINMITNTEEPQVPFWKMKVPVSILSFSAILLLIIIALAAALGVIIYRMSVITALGIAGHDSVVSSNHILFTTATAAIINLCCIVVFNRLYEWLAEYLTEIELLRTQTEFDDSLTLKIYLLQFVNYYVSIFYIAFFKGNFIGYPQKYRRIFTYRQEECGPGGCLTELSIQLTIIMIGKQAMNTILEMLYPFYYKLKNTSKVGLEPLRSNCDNEDNQYESRKMLQWVKDYKLVEWGPRSLFDEYLEMVLQYGFVTIFVAAFPLAPFFALLNNVLEMRLDAKKLLTIHRRPVGQRVKGIGIWYRILDSISKLSVITNGFIIAFTSNFIPRLVYQTTVSDNYSLDGFLEHSLAKFNTSDFEALYRNKTHEEMEMCRYTDYREPPNSPDKYEYNIMYWRVLAARLVFVVVFENFVATVMILVKWCIPDMSTKLRYTIRREAYITNEIIIHQESRRIHASQDDRISRLEPQDTTLLPGNVNSWDRVRRDSLSNSEFDLEIHGNSVSPMSQTRINSSAV